MHRPRRQERASRASVCHPLYGVESAQNKVAQSSPSRRVTLIAADDVKMGVEDVLAAGRADIPPHSETLRLEFGQIPLGFAEHLPEIGPFL